MKFKPQQRPDTCGVACVSYILQMLSYPIVEKDLYSMCRFDGGMSDKGVCELLKKFKICSAPDVMKRDKFLRDLEKNLLIWSNLITTTWCAADKAWHYVIIYKADGDTAWLLDPDGNVAPRVHRSLSYAELRKYLHSSNVEYIMVEDLR